MLEIGCVAHVADAVIEGVSLIKEGCVCLPADSHTVVMEVKDE
jgi:hypothetical protein